MGKIVKPFSGQRIVFTTTLDLKTLLSNIDAEIRKEPGLTTWTAGNIDKLDKTSFEEVIKSRLGPSGFMFFGIRIFSFIKKHYRTESPFVCTYTIGNPIVAQTMAVKEPSAMMHVPIRLVVISGDNEPTRVEYNLPSSVIAINGPADGDVYKAAVELDEKFESMIRKVTANDHVL